MSRPHCGLRGSLAAAALCVLLAGGLSPRTAAASCGDWLAGHDDADARRMVEQATGVPPTDQDRPQRAPCRGPSCSDAPSAPASPAPEITAPLERWACVADGQHAREPQFSERLPDRHVTLLPRRTSGVFRPPR